MKVFISWSGELSKSVAGLLKTWIPTVLQGVEPWMSKDDIEKGSAWFGEIQGALNSVSVGILCVTQSNRSAPWLLFEAGALSKGLSTARVCPLLIDVPQADVEPPLGQLNCANTTKEDVLKLLTMINGNRGAEAINSGLLSRSFEKWWGEFESELDAIKKKTLPAPSKPRKPEELLVEILNTVRSLRSEIRRPPSTIQQTNLNRAVERGVRDAVSGTLGSRTWTRIPLPTDLPIQPDKYPLPLPDEEANESGQPPLH